MRSKIQSGFYSNSFNWFSNVTVSARFFFFFFAFSFEKRIENFLISYFHILFTPNTIVCYLLSSVICSAGILLHIDFEYFFSSVIKSGLWNKELLNFHKLLAIDIPMFLDNEKNMGEWSVDRALKMSDLWIGSCKLFETIK